MPDKSMNTFTGNDPVKVLLRARCNHTWVAELHPSTGLYIKQDQAWCRSCDWPGRLVRYLERMKDEG